MLTKSLCIAAVVGSASAYVTPMVRFLLYACACCDANGSVRPKGGRKDQHGSAALDSGAETLFQYADRYSVVQSVALSLR